MVSRIPQTPNLKTQSPHERRTSRRYLLRERNQKQQTLCYHLQGQKTILISPRKSSINAQRNRRNQNERRIRKGNRPKRTK